MESVALYWDDEEPTFMGVCKNTGGTPALAVEIGAVAAVKTIKASARERAPDNLTIGNWGAIGGGASRQVLIFTTIPSPISPKDIGKERPMVLRGRIRYEDIGGALYESEFGFLADQSSLREMVAVPGRLDMYRRIRGPQNEENT
jgi:hypothetical protein